MNCLFTRVCALLAVSSVVSAQVEITTKPDGVRSIVIHGDPAIAKAQEEEKARQRLLEDKRDAARMDAARRSQASTQKKAPCYEGALPYSGGVGPHYSMSAASAMDANAEWLRSNKLVPCSAITFSSGGMSAAEAARANAEFERVRRGLPPGPRPQEDLFAIDPRTGQALPVIRP